MISVLNVLTSLAALTIAWCGICETINAMTRKTLHVIRLAWIALVLGAGSVLGEVALSGRTEPTSSTFFALGIAAMLLAERFSLTDITTKVRHLLTFSIFFTNRKGDDWFDSALQCVGLLLLAMLALMSLVVVLFLCSTFFY